MEVNRSLGNSIMSTSEEAPSMWLIHVHVDTSNNIVRDKATPSSEKYLRRTYRYSSLENDEDAQVGNT